MPRMKRHRNQPIETTVQPVGRINRNFDELKRILLAQCICLMLWEMRLRQQQHGTTTQSTGTLAEAVVTSSVGETMAETDVTEDSNIIKIESDNDSDKETVIYDPEDLMRDGA